MEMLIVGQPSFKRHKFEQFLLLDLFGNLDDGWNCVCVCNDHKASNVVLGVGRFGDEELQFFMWVFILLLGAEFEL